MTEFTELRIYADGDWRVVGAEHDIVTELHTAAGAEAWDVLGASEADTLAWLAATANPGAAAALLRTDDDGKVTLEGLAVGRVGSSLIPALTDTYDVGSSLLWWREGYISQLNSVIFAEQLVSLAGGWLMVPPDAGNLAGDVAATDTQVDFGKAMTPGHLILIWAKDAGGSAKKEYMEVGALVSGTTYNVTRDLAAAHGTDPAWSAGTPFCVLGTNGSGRIEINAYDTPRISVVTQGATYNAQTELVRLGDLDGEWGYSTETYGLAVGDYASGNYLLADDDHLKLAFGGEGVVLDEDGLTFFAADQIWMPGYLKFKDALGKEVCRLLSVHYVGGVETQLFTHVTGEDVAEMSLVTMCSYGPDPATATARTVISASTEGWGSSLYVEAFGYDKGRVRAGSGLLVGGGDDDWPPWGNIWVGIDARIGGGLYVGGLGVDPGPGTITATGTITGNIIVSNDYLVAVGGLRVGSSSDPGADNLSVAGVATIGDYLVAVGGLRVGSSSDPGTNNLSVAGTATVAGVLTTSSHVAVGDYLTAPGGVHVGGTSDPGTDRLIVDGHARVGLGLNVGSAGADAPSGMTISSLGASGWLPLICYGTTAGGISVNQTVAMGTVSRSMVFRSIFIATYVASTNNTSHYWTITVKKINGTVLATLYSHWTGGPGVWGNLSQEGFSTTLASSDVAITVEVTKVGSPGTLYLGGPAIFVS